MTMLWRSAWTVSWTLAFSPLAYLMALEVRLSEILLYGNGIRMNRKDADWLGEGKGEADVRLPEVAFYFFRTGSKSS